MATYRVIGIAHGERFNETGFTTETEATEYASSVIDGDYDSTIRVERERDPGFLRKSERPFTVIGLPR
jgi:hypothetical protein